MVDFYEIDCPKCQATNFKAKSDYMDGDLIQCGKCKAIFSEDD
jgi:hypothetical protein